MEYKRLFKPEILYCGEFNNHEFAIANQGDHPCAYVENKLNVTSYDDELIWDVYVHGSLTYCDKSYWNDSKKTFLGWDYAHWGDYSELSLCGEGKRYTTEEIYEDVKSVIKQLEKIESVANK